MVLGVLKLGDEKAPFERLDGLLARFDRGNASHPLTLVLIHEARARIAAQCNRQADYERSTRETERWSRQTSTSALIAKCERLTELQRKTASVRPNAATSTTSTELLTIQTPIDDPAANRNSS